MKNRMSILAFAQGLGCNYAWGLINFTAGAITGGTVVALALITANALWAIL